MPYKVLVVDDSAFFRKRLVAYLNEDPFIEVIGEAGNGIDAVLMAGKLLPDAITMDVEMPGMDGIAAVSKIMKESPTAILMLSSLTKTNAKVTLDALSAGALDYMPKQLDDFGQANPHDVYSLKRRVKAIARKYKEDSINRNRLNKSNLSAREKVVPLASRRAFRAPEADTQLARKSGKAYKVLVIAASTGGPQALQKVLSGLPSNFPHPILLVQHMPGTFTGTFAERLNHASELNVSLATDGNLLKPGCAYLAPGGRQMRLKGKGNQSHISIQSTPSGSGMLFEPCINYTLESVSECFEGNVLALILTGMGDDGTQGSVKLKKLGATIWAQDEVSSVVYGMPKSVFQSGCVDRVLNINNISHDLLIEMTS